MFLDTSHINKTADIEQSGIYLVDTRRNGKPRPWNESKKKSRILSHSYARIAERTGDPQLWKAANRVYNCGDDIEFSQIKTESGETKRKLTAANFCRDRLCPMCQWRKSLVLYTQLSRTMDYIQSHTEIYGETRCIFLTLTVKNCEASDLKMTIDQMQKSWDRFLKRLRRRRTIKGVYRVLEITINNETGEYHPHFHAMLLVSPEYFTDEYLQTSEYAQAWGESLGVSYVPVCDVRGIKNTTPKALAEVAKYTVKPNDWLSDDKDTTDARIGTLREALRGRRLVSFSGILREARRILKLDDIEKANLVNTEEDEVLRGDIVECIEHYRWSVGVASYELSQVRYSEAVESQGHPPFI